MLKNYLYAGSVHDAIRERGRAGSLPQGAYNLTRRGKIESTSSVYINLRVGKKDVGAPNFVDQLAVPERALFGGSRPLGWLRRVVERQARVGLLL